MSEGGLTQLTNESREGLREENLWICSAGLVFCHVEKIKEKECGQDRGEGGQVDLARFIDTGVGCDSCRFWCLFLVEGLSAQR